MEATHTMTIEDMMDALDEVLDKFQWAYPDRSQNRGEVEVDRDAEDLVLAVYVPDNDTPDNEHVKELLVSIPISLHQPPEDQIRDLIHMYLCHESDEQMWFGEERTFYPH